MRSPAFRSLYRLEAVGGDHQGAGGESGSRALRRRAYHDGGPDHGAPARRSDGHIQTQLKLTSLVVTHDMCLAEKLADHIIFLDRARVIFSGTVAEMERSYEPVVRNFLELDRFDMRALLSRKEPDYRIVA